ncbi:30S ribosomal protein S10 [Candidatus Vidania fulgoroideorum]
MINNIKILFFSYNQFLLNKNCVIFKKYLEKNGIKSVGPIFLPKKKKLINILKSPHIDKNSRDQIFVESYKTFIIIFKINKLILNIINLFNLPSIIRVVYLFGNEKNNTIS